MKAIAIDIGGTTIKGALIKNDRILKESTHKSFGKKGKKFILNALNNVINELHENEIDFIGISSAGNIDPNIGKCIFASPNLTGWTGFNIKDYVEKKYGISTYVNNDAVCALLAESYILSAEDKKKKIAMITIGTGIGVAVLNNGNIDYGTNFDGGMYAHYILKENGIPCSCGQNGCAEKEISATGLLKYAQDIDLEALSVYELFNLYYNNDMRVKELIENYFSKFNTFLNHLKNDCDVDIFIIGGGVAQSNDKFIENFDHRNKDIRIAQFKNRAGIMGAYIFGVHNGKIK